LKMTDIVTLLQFYQTATVLATLAALIVSCLVAVWIYRNGKDRGDSKAGAWAMISLAAGFWGYIAAGFLAGNFPVLTGLFFSFIGAVAGSVCGLMIYLVKRPMKASEP